MHNRPENKSSTWLQKLYLSAIIDLYDRSIVSYIISYRKDNNLVFRTFEKAMGSYLGATPLLHSDLWNQYSSRGLKQMLEDSEIIQSMSRGVKCINNGPRRVLGYYQGRNVISEWISYSKGVKSIKKYIAF